MNEFDFGIVKNPEIFEQNRLPAHSDHICYASGYELAEKETSLRMDLNGLWKFHYAKNMNLAIQGFEAADYDWSLGRDPRACAYPDGGLRHASLYEYDLSVGKRGVYLSGGDSVPV